MTANVHEDAPHILIIGAGVSGLTTALCLQRQGFPVTIVAEDFPPNITSVVAGALWEWPPSVCGHHHDQMLLERTKIWCMISYEAFSELARDPAETGVFMREAVFYFRTRVENNPLEFLKMNEVQAHVPGFRRDPALIGENDVNPHAGMQDAYSYLAPMVDTDCYLAWLRRKVIAAGGKIVQTRIDAPLVAQESALRNAFQADAIIDCAGLGAIELAEDDELCPHRGALIRVRNDGELIPRITKAHCVTHDTTQTGQDMVFIVPRGKDMLLLGGLVEADEWRLDIGLGDYPPIREMLKRCIDFLPSLANLRIDPEDPVRVGLRPFRNRNVRLEVEPGTRIVHNYGHGGAGITLSWGCAREVVKLTRQVLQGSVALRAGSF